MRAHKLLIVTLIAGCGGRTTSAPHSPQPVATDAVLARLTTRQKVAQLVVPWLGGNHMALDDSAFQIATRWIDTLEVGGIIISVGSPYDIAAKLNTLQRRSKLPLLVSAELEWGAAMRVVGATAFPYIMATGATGDERDAYTIGRVVALEGRAVGIHVNFAPDADVNNNPLNTIINTRSFGDCPPRRAARLAQVQRAGGARRGADGGDRRQVRRRRSGAARVRGGLRSFAHARRSRFSDRVDAGRLTNGTPHPRTTRRLRAARARNQTGGRPVRAAHRAARLDRAHCPPEGGPRCPGRTHRT